MLTLPNYEILEESFRGVTCTLYRAKRQDDHKHVLLKQPTARFSREMSGVRLRHEYEVAADLDMDAVLRTEAAIPTDEGQVIVYEDFEGCPLSMLLSRLKTDPKRVLEIGIQISRAVEEIHNKLIIHKNLNPETIFYHPETGQLKIAGFQWATLLTRESPRLLSVHAMEGLLEYVSPEQTGRAARVVDYRSDFYSMGVILYQMLTGRLPFEERDAPSLIHMHCTRMPTAPDMLDASIPHAVSEVIMKLLAKSADDRYQSLEGLRADLEHCLEGMRSDLLADFEPGQKDPVRRFRMPQKFIGREKELGVVKDALTRASRGLFSFHLIGGDAGVGKMDLVREAQKDSLKSGGYFALDGFNPLSHKAPYSAIQHAFRHLLVGILDEEPARLEDWKKEIKHAVGPNGRLLMPIIPEIVHLIGEQPSPLQLPPEEEANRLENVFLSFITGLARRSRPLVLLLTELQWADDASIKLLLSLVKRGEIPYFAFIGTCQTKKTPKGHLLEPILEKLRENAVDFGYVHVRGFSRKDLTRFTAEALGCDEKSVTPLSQLIYEKTGGNPYFVGKFLSSLQQCGLIQFDDQRETWSWDREDVARMDITENMGDFLTEKIDTFNEATKLVLEKAAIFGEEFDLRLLARLCEDSPARVASALWEAVQEGLILPMGDSYRIFIPGQQDTPSVSGSLEGPVMFRFAHGKIQTAAYDLLEEMGQIESHQKLGEILQEEWEECREDHIFIEMVHHLNMGKGSIEDPTRLRGLAEMNLRAAKRSKASAAYLSAVGYCNEGMGILGEVDESDPLFFQLRVLAAECYYLNTDLDEAEQALEKLSGQAPTGLDMARVYDLKVTICANRGRNMDGIEAGYQALRLLGIKFPKVEDMVVSATKKELERFESMWQGKTIADLAGLPQMTSSERQLAVKILTKLVPLWNQSSQSEGRRIMLLALRGINLSVENGNSAYSAVCYSLYGMFSLEWHQHARIGMELGKLGMELAEQFGSGQAICRTNNIFGAFINHWSSHARTSLDYLEKGFRAGRDYGLPVFAVYALIHKLVIKAFTDTRLSTVYRACQEYRDYVSRTGYREFQDFLLSYQWLLDQLIGNEDAFFHYDSFITRLKGYEDRIPECIHHLNEAKAAYFLEDYPRALTKITHTSESIGYLSGSLLVAEYVFFEAMSMVALYPTAPLDDQRVYLRKIEEHHRKMDFWTDHCPENFLHLKLLIEAEWMAIHERHLQAMQLFDQAIDAAHAQGYLHYEALGNELASKFYLDKGRRKIGAVYMTDAYVGYRDWGAVAKCRQLECRYREHIRLEFSSPREPNEPFTRGRQSYSISADRDDLFSLYRTSTLVATSSEMDQFLEELLDKALELTHAQSGYLVLNHESRWLVRAEGWHDERGVAVMRGIPVDDCRGLCPAIIDRVVKTEEAFLATNAVREGDFTRDPHILETRSKSILCVPCRYKDQLQSILYVQSSLIASAFSHEQASALDILLRQASGAIAAKGYNRT